jgi:hypothetical protein
VFGSDQNGHAGLLHRSWLLPLLSVSSFMARAAALFPVSSLLLGGCLTLTLRPAPELVAPLPAEDCELVYDLLTLLSESISTVVWHETPSAESARSVKRFPAL